MVADRLFEKFNVFASTDGAIQALRALVLELTLTSCLNAHNEDWPTHRFKELATKIGSGATPRGGRQAYVDSGTPLIRSMNVHFYGFEPEGLAFLSDKQAGELANVAVETNDVLLNITGASIGRVTTAPSGMAGARVNQHVMIIRPKEGVSPHFLAKFLASPTVQTQINDIQVGATRQALTRAVCSLG